MAGITEVNATYRNFVTDEFDKIPAIKLRRS